MSVQPVSGSPVFSRFVLSLSLLLFLRRRFFVVLISSMSERKGGGPAAAVHPHPQRALDDVFVCAWDTQEGLWT